MLLVEMAAEEFLCYGREKGAAMVDKLGKNSEFTEVNIDNLDSLELALRGVVMSSYNYYCRRGRGLVHFYKIYINISRMSLLKRQNFLSCYQLLT